MTTKAMAITACCVLFAEGCVTTTEQTGCFREVRFLNDGPAIAADIGYCRGTGVHPWRSGPEHFGAIQVRSLAVVIRDNPKVFEAPERGGGLYPFLVWNEESANLLLAPGFNPVRMGDLNPDMLDAIMRADQEFAGKYPYDPKQPRPNRVVRFDREQGVSLVVWTHLPEGSDNASKTPQVDHGFLIYLLMEDSLWDGLRCMVADKQKLPAVRLACQAVLDLMRAHDLAWPQFQWSDKQKAIRSWCERTVVAAGKDASSRP